MGPIFLDRTKPRIVKNHALGRRDALLWCLCCKGPTVHMFTSLAPVGVNAVDVIYECTRCDEPRAWGRENADGRENEGDDGHATA